MRDFERTIKKSGYKDLNTIGSYLSLQQIKPDLIISSLSMRAQTTASELAKKIGFKGKIYYMEELYQSSLETYLNVLSLQDNEYNSIFLIGHNPELTEFANAILEENFYKFPTLGILALKIDIDNWEEIKENSAKIDFFIQPKQFKYYVPKNIRTTLPQIRKNN